MNTFDKFRPFTELFAHINFTNTCEPMLLEPRYLIRFDDVCPTMNWDLWDQVESLLMEYKVKPIMGVIPDNRDTSLHSGAFDAGFWQRVRDWQSAGWTIALHGYQHRFVTASSGMLGINPRSEFAGLSREEQFSKLQKALAIFSGERVRPEVWVAPAHSFDEATIDSLLSLGLRTASDGFSLFPYSDERGMLRIPQQLWRFRPMPYGVWTICVHLDCEPHSNVDYLRQNLARYRGMITSLPEIVAEFSDRRKSWIDTAAENVLHRALLWKIGSNWHANAGEPNYLHEPADFLTD